jgi:hypothetical protein
MKNKFRIALGATALTVAAVAIIACSKEKTAQQEPQTEQQTVKPNDLTLAEMAETMSWEDGKAFFENQSIKDYTYACEMVINDCGFTEKSQGSSYSLVWRWTKFNGDCDNDHPGICAGTKNDTIDPSENARGYFEDGKMVIIPTTDDNGFTSDGYLAIAKPIMLENDIIVISQGIYAAYYDEESGRYVAVAVDYEFSH